MISSKNKFLIRRFRVADAPKVVRLVKQVLTEFGETFSPKTLDRDVADIPQYYFDRGGVFWVMTLGDRIVGTAGVTPITPRICKFRRFYLGKKFRGKGLGKKLYDKFLSYARKKRYREVWLSTSEKLKASTRFYKKAGFKKSRKPLWPYKRAPLFYVLKLGR